MLAIDLSSGLSLEELNKDLSLRFLEKALPGVCISSPRRTSIWDQVRKPAIPSISQSPYASYFSRPLSPPTSSYETGWSDSDCTCVSETCVSDTCVSDSISTTESEWPDWSRWSRRDSTSSRSSQSTAITVLSDDEVSKSLPRIKASESIKVESTPSTAALHPAKTGFALWVGNLSSKTTLQDLCTLFGTPKLQSIYLIQRTGCAFVNYKTKDALELAMELFASRGGQLYDHDLVIKAQYASDAEQCQCSTAPETESAAAQSPNRYFICKSLMVDDLEEAKQSGQWSTQMRNKEKFNAAFHSSRNTYLVFSANRTSAFYGIARLEAPFRDGDASCSCECPMKDTGAESEPEITSTPEFRHPGDGVLVPAGTMVFDPLRGSQFWKVDGCACVEPETEKWTAPTRISWISPTNSVVPFSRTRQLKNSLNMNKPIKVARDGTEIDPAVGEKLRKMFE